MSISGFWPGLLLASMACASAQVTVQVTQDQEQYLPGEALKVAVRVTNLSGQELHLGGEEDWLNFAMESREGVVVPKLGEAPVVGEFILQSSKVAIKRLDIAPYFALTHPGNYQIVATVRIRAWNREITSEPQSFDVIQGVKIWEQEVGVPKTGPAANSEPEMRRYVLQQANFLRGQNRLYLRVTDIYGKPIRVFSVGPMVSFARPEPRVDRFSNLHLLCQDGAFSYNYSVCNLQGDVTTRQTFDCTESRPRLRVDDEGNISVAGGLRHFAATDVPRTKQDDSDAPALPPLLPDSTGVILTNQLSVTKPAK